MTGRSAANLLSRLTTIFVGCFFVTSLALAWMAKNDAISTSVLDGPVPAALSEQMPKLDKNEMPPQVPVSN